jgi:peptidoglycan/xylan/chitin deacetylase (PgdA/CDA1 family)
MSFLLNKTKLLVGPLSLFQLLILSACTTIPEDRYYDGFIIVTAKAEDNLSSLATRYLNDPAEDWLIAEFNEIETVAPGQELIIPLSPFEWGGLKANGYKKVPILTYYGFSENKTGELIVPKAKFEEQMRFIKENGYRVITLDRLMDFLDFKGQIPEKSVVITFDDGWRSLYDFAFPILKNYGFPATLFVYTDFIGSKNALSWEQIKELGENGIDIQSKTKTHRNMAKLQKKESFKGYLKALEIEISHSKKLIEQKLNKECKYMAYPHGETNNLVIAFLKKHGYRAAFTLKRQSNPFFVNNYMINRSVIYGEFGMEQFRKNLSVFKKAN